MSDLHTLSKTLNDLDDRMPKGRSECFDIGIGGGCGFSCPVFQRGDCNEPTEVFEHSDREEVNEDEIEEFKLIYKIR